MSFKDDLIAVLSGGLPSLLEFPDDPVTLASIPTMPVEELPPEPTNRDSENFLGNVSQNQILAGTAAIVGVIALVFFLKN